MRRFLLFILLFAGIEVSAQNNYIGKSDPEARSVLKKVSAKYKTYKTLSLNFSMTIENGQGQKVAAKEGTLELKGNKYYMEMDGDASYSDGSNIYNYDKSAKEVQITRVNPKDNTLTPQKLFTDFYEKDFLYKLNEDITKGGKVIREVELTPTDKTQPYFKVLLEIDKSTSNILGAKIFEKNGNKYIYSMSALIRDLFLIRTGIRELK